MVRAANQKKSRTIIGYGHITSTDQTIRLIDPEKLLPCKPGEVGEIWVSGPSVAQGYWNKPEKTKDTFNAYLSHTQEGPFLRTGDLGFIEQDHLFVAGRIKDLIIIRGQNYYPQDIEKTIENSHPSLRKNGCAAFSIIKDNKEKLIIVSEVDRRYYQRRQKDIPPPQERRDGIDRRGQEAILNTPDETSSYFSEDPETIMEAIREAVAENHELNTYAIILIKAGNIPKTSSGKIQRHLCRKYFLEGKLEALASSKNE